MLFGCAEEKDEVIILNCDDKKYYIDPEKQMVTLRYNLSPNFAFTSDNEIIATYEYFTWWDNADRRHQINRSTLVLTIDLEKYGDSEEHQCKLEQPII